MKKPLFLCIVVILTLSASALAQISGISEWAEQEVNEAIELGFVLEDLQCNYQENITRAEFAATAVEYLSYQNNLPIEDMMEAYRNNEIVDNAYTDISDTKYQHYILYATELGIVKGYQDGTFKPDAYITREEAAAMLMRTFFSYSAGIKHGPELLEFEKYIDYGEISAWAINDVEYVWELKVMQGVSENEFSPKTNYTREQCFATFLRLYKNAP